MDLTLFGFSLEEKEREKKLSTCTEEVKQLNGIIDKIEVEKNKLIHKLNQLTDQINEKEKENHCLKKSVSDLQSSEKLLLSNNEKICKQLQSSEDEKKLLLSNNEKLNKQLQSSEDEKKVLLSSNEKLKNRLQSSEDEKKVLLSSNEKLKKQSQTSEDEKKVLLSSNEKLKKQSQTSEDEKKLLLSSNEKLMEQLQSSEDEKNQLKRELEKTNDILKRQSDQIKSQQKIAEENTQLQIKIKNINTQLEAEKKNMKKTEDNLKEKVFQNFQLESKVKEKNVGIKKFMYHSRVKTIRIQILGNILRHTFQSVMLYSGENSSLAKLLQDQMLSEVSELNSRTEQSITILDLNQEDEIILPLVDPESPITEQDSDININLLSIPKSNLSRSGDKVSSLPPGGYHNPLEIQQVEELTRITKQTNQFLPEDNSGEKITMKPFKDKKFFVTEEFKINKKDKYTLFEKLIQLGEVSVVDTPLEADYALVPFREMKDTPFSPAINITWTMFTEMINNNKTTYDFQDHNLYGESTQRIEQNNLKWPVLGSKRPHQYLENTNTIDLTK